MVFEYCDQVYSPLPSSLSPFLPSFPPSFSLPITVFSHSMCVCLCEVQDLKKYFDSLAAVINPKVVQV